MCVITDKNHIVTQVTLLEGVYDWEADGYHVYFPVKRNEIPNEGEYYNPNSK